MTDLHVYSLNLSQSQDLCQEPLQKIIASHPFPPLIRDFGGIGAGPFLSFF